MLCNYYRPRATLITRCSRCVYFNNTPLPSLRLSQTPQKRPEIAPLLSPPASPPRARVIGPSYLSRGDAYSTSYLRGRACRAKRWIRSEIRVGVLRDLEHRFRRTRTKSRTIRALKLRARPRSLRRKTVRFLASDSAGHFHRRRRENEKLVSSECSSQKFRRITYPFAYERERERERVLLRR